MNYDRHQPIIPDPVLPMVPSIPGSDADATDYATMCADVDGALESAWWRVIEWDRAQDPHGWWHDRSDWIALHNEVLRLRAELKERQ